MIKVTDAVAVRAEADPGGSVVARAIATFVVVLVGLIGAALLFGTASWWWVLVIPIGLIAGAVARRARLVWVALAATVVFDGLAIGLDLPRDSGPFWYIAAIGVALVMAAAFVEGTSLGTPRPPLATTRDAWRSWPHWARRASIIVSVVIVLGLLGYGTYAAISGSADFTEAVVTAPDCRTPADRYRWDYEAINYDKADDARLTAANPDKTKCSVVGVEAGTNVVTPDGVRLAGWYIPAANGSGPSGPTLLVVHGWKANKSGALEFAQPFHDAYNLVLFDLRNNGQSSGTQTTMGLREQGDVIRMLDWLETTKHPIWMGAVGNSMGAATVLGAAVADQRIRALILDSMHADIVTSVGNAMEEDFGYPGGPAAVALMTGVSIRIGGDVTAIDPVRLIGRLGDRPVLLIQGTADQVDPPAEASDRNFQAALAAGVPVEVAYCPGARHGLTVKTCPSQWASWATSFLELARKH
jgi:pimeloyl-ACP methyl ester carboxylesterase